MKAVRSTLFMAYAIVWSMLTAPLVVIAALALRGLWGYRFGKLWRLGIQFGVENILGIRPKVIGLENMPKALCHSRQAPVRVGDDDAAGHRAQRGLLCFRAEKGIAEGAPGWLGLAAMKMISIDRAAGKDALDQVVIQGRERLKQGFYVILFPEGTRVAPGQKKRFKPGGAYLATHVGCKVVPVAHNAGELWPRQAFLKTPGTVTISIGPAFDATGMTEADVNQRAEAWIEDEMHRISPHRYSDASHNAT
jgi:1-acyl-sn-glycerol-3-phosphate acyltransferase